MAPQPLRASHFGGLCKAIVGSFKRLMKKMQSMANLTYEDFHNVVCSWEVILNSGSLYHLPGNRSELHVLTSAHFLIQRAFLAFQSGEGSKKFYLKRSGGSSLVNLVGTIWC